MKETKSSRLSGRYLAALRAHFEQGPRAGLKAANELGSQAVAAGLETLDLAKIHDRALVTLVLPGCSSITRDDMTHRASLFFTEASRPLEETHRAALEVQVQLNKLNVTLAKCTLDLADSGRELQQGIAHRKSAEETLKTRKEESAKLIEESRHLHKHLQDMARQVLSAAEDERRTMSLKLQDEIAQTLLGIHVRLLALKNEVSVSNEDFKKEIATTQRLVRESVKIIDRFAREFGAQHED